MEDWRQQYRVDVPTGQSGSWSIERFQVTKDASKLSSLRDGWRWVAPGTYTRLTRDGQIVMSDTQAEISDHFCLFHAAKGHVLLNGLGLGMALQGVATNPEVTHVTAIEKSHDVIALVAEHYRQKFKTRITIIEADAFAWIPPQGVRFGAVWHDIWDNITADNLPEMQRLHRKYGRRCDWQGSWCREICEQHRRNERRGYW